MAFVIRHDVPAGMTAMLATMAGQATGEEKRRQAQLQRSAAMSQTAARIGASRDMQVQRLDEAARQQHESIQARAEAQQQQIEAVSARAHQTAEYAKDRMAYGAGLQEELEEQKFGRAMEKMEVEANQQAQQFEWKMDVTAKKLQNEARRNLTFLSSPEATKLFDSGQIRQLTQQAELQIRNPIRTPVAREPQPDDNLVDSQGNPVKFNQVFTDDAGDRVSYEIGSRGQVVRQIHTPYRYSQQYLEAKMVQEQEQALGDIDQKRREYAGKLMEKPVPTYDASGEGTGETRMLEFSEAMKRARYVYPIQAPSKEQSEADRQQQIETQQAKDAEIESAIREPVNMWAWIQAWDVRLTPAEEKLPRNEGQARAFARELRKRQKAGQEISADMIPAIKESFLIIEREKSYAKTR